MNIVYVLAPLALLLGLGFAISYIVATHRGQFDDLETPAHRMLIDDEFDTPKTPAKAKIPAKKGPHL
jgi:cbb3-type cytochrome oxidase maturation protein